MIGITSYGAYIPRLRLNRMAIVQAMGWFAPAIMTVAQGERSMCNWDEDSITMAVSAARDCLRGRDKQNLDAVYLASTTLPFADRQNAGILAAALNLKDQLTCADFTACQKTATTALITALEQVAGGARRDVLVTATDRRETKTAYFYEMWFGDGAAALTVGDTDVIAEFKGSFSLERDFVDHYRGARNTYDYVWEERWNRDEGYGKIMPEAIQGLLDKQGLGIDDIHRLAYPCFFKADHRKIAKTLGAKPETLIDNLHEVCGECGAAHSFLLLIKALETAQPGEKIVVAGYGQGANALLFEVTDNITRLGSRNGLTGSLANKKTIDNYAKWLKFRELINVEMGIRAEAPTQTATTVLYRKNKMILGLVGGKCRECGAPQFPKSEICVNPACGALHSQDDYEFADCAAKVKTFTGDMLAVSVDPPAIYGMVQFDNGGRMMADFTDCELADIRVGLPVTMEFKRKGVDKERGFVNYFWKAVPVPGALAEMNKIRFDGRVAIVTGAGAGLGRTYALELARRGAAVVVNDLGSARDGSGAGSSSPADQVVEEIRAAGGQAVANYDNVATVDGGANIVGSALEAFGRIDIVINNAGILRDKSFVKMTPENWNAVLAVHLHGAYHVTRPAFEAMKNQGYGRIIMTTSAAGLYGNFGQANYSAAKMGLVGLMNTLKLEGQKYDIKVNTIAPLAASRLTEDVMPPEIFEKMRPEFVAPMVLYLASEHCNRSGEIYNAGMGYYNRAAILTGPGAKLGDAGQPPSAEDIWNRWEEINDLTGAKALADANTALMDLMTVKKPAAKAATDPANTEAGPGDTEVAAIFDKMPAAFQADKAAGVDAVFQYVITGPGGGEWTVAVKDQKCTVEKSKTAKATCTLKIAAADFLRMIGGELPAMQAFTSGKLQISGDAMKSQLIGKLFKL
jgi:3-hydroxy-3-methylglutaryl CoA synthase/NAD(P)-dependent dehydrogenase (short-subunit alcohol dehydrogenase family)/putative sterol carrier protein